MNEQIMNVLKTVISIAESSNRVLPMVGVHPEGTDPLVDESIVSKRPQSLTEMCLIRTECKMVGAVERSIQRCING